MKWSLILLFTVFLISCSKTAEPESSTKQVVLETIQKTAPSWIKDNNSSLSAYGSAYKTTGGVKFQQTEAVANAKEALREKIRDKVAKILEATFKTISLKHNVILNDERVKEIYKKIGTHVSLRSITSSKKESVWFDEKENLFILISIDPNVVKDFSISSTETLLRSDKDLFRIYEKNNGKSILNFYLKRELFN